MVDPAKKRLSLILEQCKTPKTINQMAESLNTSYWTIHPHVMNLRRAGALVELPFRKHRAKLYQTALESEQGTVPCILIPFGEDVAYSPMQLISNFNDKNSYMKIFPERMAGALAHLYIRSDAKAKNLGEVAPSAQDVKRNIFEWVEWLKAMVGGLEMLLLSELFTDSEVLFSRMGEFPEGIDKATLTDLAVAWEHWWVGQFGKG